MQGGACNEENRRDSLPRLGDTRVRAIDGAVMVYVPAGEFRMGTDDSDYDEERLSHVVRLDGFWLDRTPVTSERFAMFLADRGRVAPTFEEQWDANRGEHPAGGVTWDDAAAYCEWAGARLPTEAEWEYAARGPDGWTFPWGNVWDASRCNSAEGGLFDTSPVEAYANGASWCGALGLAGNVWEWMADWDGAYSAESVANPTGPVVGEARVIRGGSFFNSRDFMRGAFRYCWFSLDDPAGDIGFRCAASL